MKLKDLLTKESKVNKKTGSFICLIIILSMIASFIAINKYPSLAPAGANFDQIREAVRDSANTNLDLPTITTTPIEKIYRNPFNGNRISKEVLDNFKNRPLAIMMDNSPPARLVQENLNRSDMVYEALTESGFTRFMAIYYSDQSDFRVMPVRSVRLVFLDNLEEYNDILLYHVGGANTPAEPRTNALDRLIKDKVKSLYFYNGNLWQTFNELYDEACFKKDIPGYSCKYRYTSTLWKKANDVGYQKEKWEPDYKFDWMWKFDEGNVKNSDKKAELIKYKFTGSKLFDAEWKYNPSTNKYTRKITGQKLIDHATSEEVWTNTIVVQKIKYKLNVDDKHRSIATTIGEGEGIIFMNGKAYEATWEKDCVKCRTRYFNKDDGKEFVFSPGKIWVSVTRVEEKVEYE